MTTNSGKRDVNEEQIIRVAVVDDQPLVRMGMVRVLGAAPDLMVGLAAGSGDELLALLRSHMVDVCMLDINMPGISARETLSMLQAHHKEVRVVMFSGDLGSGDDTDWHALGAVATLGKEATPDEILDVIRRAAAR